MFGKSTGSPASSETLPGREAKMPVPAAHYVNGHPLQAPFPAGMQQALFGMGCFWGAERKFWELKGVYSTAVGYAAGKTPNPSYREVCSGMTGHAEVVLVVFDPAVISYDELLRVFWESHNPDARDAAGQRRRHPVSVWRLLFRRSAAHRGRTLSRRFSARAVGRRLRPYHDRDCGGAGVLLRGRLSPAISRQESGGYCGLGGTGVSCPVGVVSSSSKG